MRFSPILIDILLFWIVWSLCMLWNNRSAYIVRLKQRFFRQKSPKHIPVPPSKALAIPDAPPPMKKLLGFLVCSPAYITERCPQGLRVPVYYDAMVVLRSVQFNDLSRTVHKIDYLIYVAGGEDFQQEVLNLQQIQESYPTAPIASMVPNNQYPEFHDVFQWFGKVYPILGTSFKQIHDDLFCAYVLTELHKIPKKGTKVPPN